MKKTVLKAATVLAAAVFSLGLTGSAAAQQLPADQVGVERLDEFVYLVRISNPTLQAGRLQLVRATDGAVLYEKQSSDAAFGQKLNVQNLPDGQYAFVVKLGKDTRRYTLNLRTTTQRTTDVSMASAARP